MNATLVSGIVCNKCGIELPQMLMSEHLDINNPKNKMCGCIQLESAVYVDTNKLNRIAVFEKHRHWLGKKVDGKGRNKRMQLFRDLQRVANITFISEEEEYQLINKFGRGIWTERVIKAFTLEEQEIIINEIATIYGAFDY